MSVQATSWVWDHSQAEGNARLVLLAIADGANKQGRRSCQSAKTIGDMCRLSSRSVQRHIALLLESGELVVEGTHGKYHTNIYALPGLARYDSTDVRQNDVYDSRGSSLRQNKPVATTELCPPTPLPHLPHIDAQSASGVSGDESAFDQWWEIYPRKKSKSDAKTAFKAAIKKIELDQLVAATRKYAREQRGSEEKFIKYPAGWLRKQMWEDYLPSNGATTGPESLTVEEINEALGPTNWAPPEPDEPPEDQAAWLREQYAEHHRQRQYQAWEVINGKAG